MQPQTLVEKTITINATPSKVWEVLTNPEIMSQWVTDIGVQVVSGFKVGNPIVFSGKWHGVKRVAHGIILEFEPQKVFKYSFWTKISRLPDKPENYTVIEFKLMTKVNQTILSVIHSNLIAETAYEHSNYYWGVTLGVIKGLVESR